MVKNFSLNLSLLILLNFIPNEILSQSSSFEVKPEDVRNLYTEWLERSTLNTLFRVDDVGIEAGKFSIHFVSENNLDPKVLALSWNAVNDSLSVYNLDLPTIMLKKLSDISGAVLENCEAVYKSQNENIFGIRVSYVNKMIVLEENLVLIRGEQQIPIIETALILDNPSGTLVCMEDLKSCKERVGKILKKYLKNSYGVDQDSFTHKEVNQFHDQYKAEGIKNVITDRYNEKIVFDFNFQDSEKLVIIEYEITGWYASGFNSQGKYRDLRTSYYTELVSFEEPFERFFKSKL